tara:strand:- start:6083 stop:9229 length:3147 start_codon:yes stop_codon:yes gene_type:complete
MEFIGKTGYTYDGGQNIDDSRCSLDLGFYISNRYQFNFIYPKMGMFVKLDYLSHDYGGPLLDGQGTGANPAAPTGPEKYICWKKSYPFEAIEGFQHDGKIARGYSPISKTGYTPTAMKPNERYFNPSDQRFYIGQEFYTGPYFMPYTDGKDQNQIWNFYQNRADLELPIGFSTPSAVQERLTAQLHQRNGPATAWELNSVNAAQFSITAAGQIFEQQMPGVTDETYNTFKTSTGSPFYARSVYGASTFQGWGSAFIGEKSGTTEVPAGTNFNSIQGNYQFWTNLLCAEQPTWIANGKWQLMTRSLGVTTDLPDPSTFPQQIDQLMWTGDTQKVQYTHEGITYNIGAYGCTSCLLDTQKILNNKQFYYCNKLNQVSDDALVNNPHTALWDINSNDLIVINNYYTLDNLEQAGESFTSGKYLYNSIDTDNPLDQSYLNNIVVDFILGKIDDENTLCSANRIVYLPNPFMISNNAIPGNPFVGTGSPPVDPGGPQGHSYTEDMVTPPYTNRSATTIKYPRLYGGSRDSRGGKYNVPVFVYGDKSLTAEDAMNNGLKDSSGNAVGLNLYPHNANSKWQTAIPNGNIKFLRKLYQYAQLLNNKKGVGVIPVFLKPSLAVGDKAKLMNIPFFSVRAKEMNNTYPLPSEGEFFTCGTSALTPNAVGKIVTTQKTATDTYPQNDDLDAQDYMPYIYCGASDALINFDDTYSRFTMSKFHTPVRPGNGTFQNIDQKENTQPEIDSLSVYEQEAALCTQGGDGNVVGYNAQTAIPRPQPVISTQAGIGIIQMILYVNENKSLDKSASIVIGIGNQDKYVNSLFDKCGFSLEQILPQWGFGNNEFNRGNYNKYLGTNSIDPFDKQLNMVKPFTTNAYISASIILSLVQGIAVKSTESGAPASASEGPVPSANLGALITKQSMTNADSDILVASGMPQKLDYPYLVVYTDIVRNPLYYGGPDGRQKLSAIAYITRNYAEGDFFYSFATGWSYTADQDYILTDITTDIRLPDGTPAPIDKNSSVIYKIQTTKAMPNPPAILQAVQQQQKIDEKLQKKETKK